MIHKKDVFGIVGSQMRALDREASTIRRQRERLHRRQDTIALAAFVPGAIGGVLGVLDRHAKQKSTYLSVVLEERDRMESRIEWLHHQVQSNTGFKNENVW